MFSKLRKAGRYADAYTRGERTAVGKKKTPLEKTPSTTTPIIPSTVPSILPSVVPSTVPSITPIQEIVEDNGVEEIASIPIGHEELAKPSLEEIAKELNVDTSNLHFTYHP